MVASAFKTKADVAGINKAKEKAREAADTGRHRDAIQLLEGVVERAPGEWAAVRQLGELYDRVGRKKDANACHRRVAEHFEEEGRQASAAALWQKVVRNEPAFHGAYLKLGSLYAQLGRRVEARRHYETVLEAYRGQGREGEVAVIEGLLAELSDALPASTRAPADSSPDTLGVRSAGSSDGPCAAASAHEPPVGPARTTAEDTAVEAPPEPGQLTGADEAEYVEERLLQGRLLRRYGLLAQARAELELVLERVPDHAEAREELCELLQEQGEHPAAAELRRSLEGHCAPAVPQPEASQAEPTEQRAEQRPPGRQHAGTAPPPTTSEAPLPTADLEGLGTPVEGPLAAPALDPLEVDLFADLGAELAPVDEPASTGEAGVEGEAGEDRRQSPAELDAMVDDFRDRVDALVDGNDFETRYNLGIAYRGMGLLDEAIGEFQRAAKDPGRLFDCAGLLATCFVDKGLPQLAVSWLERGLRVPGRSDEECQELRYELARTLELVGQGARAGEIYVELYGENARLRDVAERVTRLAAPPALESTGTAEHASGDRRGVVLPWRRD